MLNKAVLIIMSVALIITGVMIFFKQKPEQAHIQAHHNHEETDDSVEASTTIDTQSAKAAGFSIDIAGPAVIYEMVTLSGRVVLNRNTTANVRARFPGIVRKVAKNLGDQVKKGDLLASIESNDSLQVYSVLSPISGVILSRNTNVGDVAAEEPLFVIADLSDLWGEFHVFPSDVIRVAVQQKVHIVNIEAGLESDSFISSLLPLIETATQTVVARVPLRNTKGQWRPGMMVQARVIMREKKVPIALRSSALQSLRGSTVAFIKQENNYEARKLTLGLNDGEHVEILEGIESGVSYVSANSFLIKADIEKSGASHDH